MRGAGGGGEAAERRGDDALVGAGAVVDHGGRRVCGHALRDHVGGELLDLAEAHVDRHRLAGAGEARPVARDLAVAAVPGDEDAGLGVIAMRQRNPGIGGAADRRRDAGADLERHAMLGQRLDLLAAAPEHEGIAALEAQHALARAGVAHQHGADLLLRRGVVVGALADIDALGLAAHEFEDFRRDQPVVEHDLGLLHQAQRAEGQQIGVAGAGADEIDLAAFGRPPRGEGLERFDQGGARARHVARQRPLADGAVERLFPEAAARLRIAEPRPHRAASFLHQRGQAAVARGNRRLEPGPQPPRQQRRGAAGGDGDEQGLAVYDRGQGEIALVRPLGDRDPDARRSGEGAGAGVRLGIAAGGDAERGAGEIFRLQRARHAFAAPGARLGERFEIADEFGREGAHPRARLEQRLRPPRRRHAAARQDDRPAAHVQADGQMIHGSGLRGLGAPV